MQLSKEEIGALLSAFADALNNMSQEEYAQLLTGAGRFQFFSDSQRKPGTPKGKEPLPSVKEVAEKLNGAVTREDAWNILAVAPRAGRKKYLTELAIIFGVHITKQDTTSRIEDKLIESVVGAKIRSETIQKLPL